MGHRPCEEMAILGGLTIIVFTYMQYDYNLSLINECMTCLFIFISIVHEGFRLAALPYYLGFFLQFANYVIAICIYNDRKLLSVHIAVIFIMAIVAHGLIIAFYGPGDLSKLVFDGQYKVGAREFYTGKHGNEMFVYYPIDQEEYECKIADNDIPHCKYGKTYAAEQAKTQKWASGGLPLFANLCYEQTFVMQDVVRNANIANDFKDGKQKKLRPILFSHGFTSKNTDYVGMFKYLASHGYIVFALNHRDQSCQYTVGEDGKPVYFDMSVYHYVRPRREEQMEVRGQELVDFRQELEDMDEKLHQKIFGNQNKTSQIDMKYFCLSGHSFGGNSALYAASKIDKSKVHAVLCTDPWVFAFDQSWNTGDLTVNVPMQLISSEGFWNHWVQKKYMDGWKTIGNILKHGKSDSQENICALNLGHTSQHDHIIFQPFSIGLIKKAWPERNLPDIYMMYPQLFLRFLAELDQKEKQNGNFKLQPYVKDLSKALIRLKKMEPNWLKYDMRHAYTNPY